VKTVTFPGPFFFLERIDAESSRDMKEKGFNDATRFHPLLPFVLLLMPLFFGSGCAALIYEIVWFQMLQLVIGSTAVSLGILLGTYMGGMCLGSILSSRIISHRRHPLKAFALLELGIGLIGILILFSLPYAAPIYSAHTGGGLFGAVSRGVLAAVCLLPPTILMGATLPTVSRWVEASPRGISWLGMFYGSNIAGGVFGCPLAGFYLLRVHDAVVATCVAAAVNGTVALAALTLAASEKAGSRETAARATSREDAVAAGTGAWLVHVAIALSGATALGAEVIWTRLLSLMLGGTVYTFSIILAVFLLGLGIGGGLVSMRLWKQRRAFIALGGCQWLLTAAMAWTAHWLAQPRNAWPIDPALSPDPWTNFHLDIARCLWALLPATFLWGASFPLALMAADRGGDPARLVGGIYAANTIGAITGGVGFSLIFIPLAGTQQSQRLLIGLSALAAVLILAPSWCSGRKKPLSAGAGGGLAILAALLFLPAWFVWSVPGVPGELIAFGRHQYSPVGRPEILFAGEGMNASVAVSESRDGRIRNFHVSGKIEASNWPKDMRLQRMLGDLPAVMHPHPESVLVVGCGAGVTAGSFTVFPDVNKITICELEPLVPKIAARYFSEENYNVLKSPRAQVVYDDGRHYLLTTHGQFDIITSDPIHPWVKGSAELYTREYFELVKKHLKPGGFATQWAPLYGSTPDVVKSEMATFFEVFPNGTVWSNDPEGKGYDLVLLGQAGETAIHLDEVEQRLAGQGYSEAAKSLQSTGFKSALDLFSTYAGQARDLAPWLKGARINRDRNLRLEYLAGLSSNLNLDESIYEEISAYRQFPDALFIGPIQLVDALKSAIAGVPSTVDGSSTTNGH
jgi:spermidine synthase